MNRSIITLSLVFGLLLTSSAFAAGSSSATDSSNSFQNKVQAQKELNQAIRTRQIRYLLELKRGHEDRNTKFANHQYNLFRNNVNTRSTFLSRSGELNSVPQYSERRPSTNASLAAPNNSKRNFRVRAIDYYVEAGDAGKKILEENVKLGSEHTVKRRYFDKQIGGQKAYADVISQIRQLQRSKYAKSNPDAKFVPFSQRTGSTGRNYLHPYMKSLE